MYLNSLQFDDSINQNRRGFINKEALLQHVTQEEIFSLVFGFVPSEFDYVLSPFRRDRHKGCWFEFFGNTLRFKDFGNSAVSPTGIRMSNMDCFNAVQVYFNLPSFYATLEYIQQQLVYDKRNQISISHTSKPLILDEKKKVKILIDSRPFIEKDKEFWQPYGISSTHLKEDYVFPTRQYFALNTKKGTINEVCRDLCYAYTHFENGKKKLYFPLREKGKKFTTNCTSNDIGGIDKLMKYGQQLIITKSYKDYRVLFNQGKNVIWFQSENMIPNSPEFMEILRNYKQVIVWFDNDSPGILASQKLCSHINSLFPSKAASVCFEERLLEKFIKDPSDCFKLDNPFFYTFLHTHVR
jgi:hypothetical protein